MESDSSAGHLADPDAGSAQVAEDGDGHAGLRRDAPDALDGGAGGVVAAVREVDAHDVESGGDHAVEHVLAVAGGSECGDDFCPFLPLGRHMEK